MNDGCRKALMIGSGVGRTGMLAVPFAGPALSAMGAAGGGASAASGAASAAGGGGAMTGLLGSLLGGGGGGGEEDPNLPFQVGDLNSQRQAALEPIDFGDDLSGFFNRKPRFKF